MDDDVEMEVEEPSLELGKLTKLIEKIAGKEVLQCLKSKYKNVRGFLESTAAVSQCRNVIGDFTSIDERTGKPHVCWICGFEIVKDDESFKPECEHIFPIAQAVIFTALYREVDVQFLRGQSPDESVKELKEKYIKTLKPEYAWAHRLCNQIKSDAHFITLLPNVTDYTQSRWGLVKEKIPELLQAIVTTNKYGNKYGNKKKRMIDLIAPNSTSTAITNQRIKEWIDTRSKIIAERCSEILKGIKPEDENMTLLSSAAALDHDIRGSGCVDDGVPVEKIEEPEEKLERPPQLATPLEPEAVTREYLDKLFEETLASNSRQFLSAIMRFIEEKKPRIRVTPEVRKERARISLPFVEPTQEEETNVYKKIENRYNELRSLYPTRQDIVVLNEVMNFEFSSMFLPKAQALSELEAKALSQVEPKEPKSVELKNEVNRLQTTIKNINALWEELETGSPQSGIKRKRTDGGRKTRRNKKKRSTRRNRRRSIKHRSSSA